MEIERRVQFGAVSVIVNGLLALSIMSPGTAVANPCTLQVVCQRACETLTYCQAIAKPGCTATSVVCDHGGVICPPLVGTVCHYD